MNNWEFDFFQEKCYQVDFCEWLLIIIVTVTVKNILLGRDYVEAIREDAGRAKNGSRRAQGVGIHLRSL